MQSRLKRGREGGTTQIRAEHILEWFQGSKLEEGDDTLHNGKGDRWWMFVDLMKEVWRTGRIPTQILWVVIVLIKSTATNFDQRQTERRFFAPIFGHRDPCPNRPLVRSVRHLAKVHRRRDTAAIGPRVEFDDSQLLPMSTQNSQTLQDCGDCRGDMLANGTTERARDYWRGKLDTGNGLGGNAS